MASDNITLSKDRHTVNVKINPKIFSMDIIYSAAYVFLDRAYVMLDGNPGELVIAELKPKNPADDLEIMGREFFNELINYSFYKQQVEKTGELRKMIVERALLSGLQEKSYLDDPEGIAIPWEIKYGKKHEKSENSRQ
jgi:His-Xaa-Ser system protein HxsD